MSYVKHPLLKANTNLCPRNAKWYFLLNTNINYYRFYNFLKGIVRPESQRRRPSSTSAPSTGNTINPSG